MNPEFKDNHIIQRLNLPERIQENLNRAYL
jgi:hypothetical protein